MTFHKEIPHCIAGRFGGNWLYHFKQQLVCFLGILLLLVASCWQLNAATQYDVVSFKNALTQWQQTQSRSDFVYLMERYEVLVFDSQTPQWLQLARNIATSRGVNIEQLYQTYITPVPVICPTTTCPPAPPTPPAPPPPPQQPEEPVAPTEPTQPTQPTTPEQPPVPTDPTPIQPEQPEEPSTPLVPEEPTQPTPIEPEQPSEPTAPIEPGTPEQPTTPIEPTPEEPTQPTPPDNPEQPQEPTIPEQPQQPEEPIIPTEPVPPATAEASAQEEEFCIFDFIISLVPGIVIVPSEQKKTRGNPESFTLTCLRYGIIIYHNIFCTSCQNRTGTARCDRRLQRIVPFHLKQ